MNDKMSDRISMNYHGSKIEIHNADGGCSEKGCSSEVTRYHELRVMGMRMYVTLCDRHSTQLQARGEYTECGEPLYRFDTEKDAYMIPCKRVDAQYVFWCDWCATEHRHGAIDGYRVAHCEHGKNSPYEDKDIYIYEGDADDPPHEPDSDFAI